MIILEFLILLWEVTKSIETSGRNDVTEGKDLKNGGFFVCACVQNLLNVCERIPTIGTQLKILSTVKATMLGAQGEVLALICHRCC